VGEGLQRVGRSDLEVEVVADPVIADRDLHPIARAVPEKHYFQPIRHSVPKLDPASAPGALVECRRRSRPSAAAGPDTEQRPAILTVSLQEYDIADVRPVFGKGRVNLQHGATLDR
jgi:hypothetical protein